MVYLVAASVCYFEICHLLKEIHQKLVPLHFNNGRFFLFIL